MKGAYLTALAWAFLISLSAIGYCAAPPEHGVIIPGLMQMPTATVEALLPNANPANYYGYAARLWQQGEKDKALLWYSIARLRAHFTLAAHPREDPSGGPALFGSLESEVGPPIIQYAATNPKNWAAQIDAALQWDLSNPNGYTSKSDYKKQWDDARNEMTILRNQVTDRAPELQKKRMQVGKMPTDWPDLEAETSVDRLVGTFRIPDLRVGMWLFDGPQANHATTIEIRKVDPGEILVIARRGEEELARRTISVQEEAGAILWKWDAAVQSSRDTHTEHRTVRLRINVASDLVVQTESLSEPPQYGDEGPYIFWYRATRME